ncbi:hypothetical protein JOD43_000281 [Pullulanibacillus pueri]|uniref:DUF3397 domain-containing protein n=1 Tax=Pullulanibacillus pueri TaxID=1437324 RepID=A0A8J2ZS07_9BACL|nr:DUF3397 domain-containing protein [Pullulanibacillus pueri]MBM7680122.1 hypothetical protein [Pullulanibacillus pueri]GGH74463.1 hypothetical protein GCM10007096_02720 [Pullulanibacillus pueri]
MTLFIYLFAVLIAAPMVTLFALYWLFKGIFKEAKKALHWSVDITTFFTILSVDVVMYGIWHHHFFGRILFAFILIAFLFTGLNWIFKDNIQPKKLIRGAWRFNFLIFMSLYIVLIIYGLISGIANQI